ncbi:hypothetical protein [Streptomyces sp. NPDC086787]|uniref:hypothetical protein n=1 Tax=Streptomyces sp. NPDC086787 TaxID=3365759 RepID=UPI00380CEF12
MAHCVATGDQEALKEILPSPLQAAAAVSVVLPDTHEGHGRSGGGAGLHVTTKGLVDWLSDSEYNIRRDYGVLIHTAYENVAVVQPNRFPTTSRTASTRSAASSEPGPTNVRAAPGRLTAAHRRPPGQLGRDRELWLAGELTDDECEDHFIDDVIVEDIGEGTDGWEFPGASCSVEVRSHV